jgi:hypothetical protein
VREVKRQPGTIEPEHGRVKGAVIDTLHAAREDYDAVVRLTRDLVRIPSRGEIDPYEPVLRCMADWLAGHGLSCRRLAGPGGATVALTGRSSRLGTFVAHMVTVRRGRRDPR